MKILRTRRAKNESNRLAKECIVTALIELMKVRDYHRISITDITRKAGVSRMAYYRNYTSKEDILNKYMEDVGIAIHERLENIATKDDMYGYFLALFEQLGAHMDIGITAYRANLGELILHNITKNMKLSFPPDDKDAESRHRYLFLAGAFYNVFIEWLKSGCTESCEEMARVCATLASEGCHTEKGANTHE